MDKHLVEAWGSGLRLDVYIQKSGLTASRSKAREWIDAGGVLLNDKKVTAHTLVSEGDALSLTAIVSPEDVASPEADFMVVFTDPAFLVIEKPSGVLVHPTGATTHAPILTTALVARYPEITKVGEHTRPGIVHRLDRDVSGLMVIPRTPESFDYFQLLFLNRAIQKKYVALVHGVVREDSGEITLKIARSVRRKRMAARPESQEGKDAITRFWVRQRFPQSTLLDVEILTGRTHQIRAHLFAKGHPIVGDTLYPATKSGRFHLPRPFLHAAQLHFVDPAGVERTFTSALPADLAGLLKELESAYHPRTP